MDNFPIKFILPNMCQKCGLWLLQPSVGVKVNGRKKKSDIETSQLSLVLGQELLKRSLSLSEHGMHFACERQTGSLLSSCPGAGAAELCRAVPGL